MPGFLLNTFFEFNERDNKKFSEMIAKHCDYFAEDIDKIPEGVILDFESLKSISLKFFNWCETNTIPEIVFENSFNALSLK